MFSLSAWDSAARRLDPSEVGRFSARNFRRAFLEKFENSFSTRPHDVPGWVKHLLKMESKHPNGGSSLIRMLLTRVVAWDPLTREKPLPYSIYVLAAPKDLVVLPVSIYSIATNYENFSKKITVVGPLEVKDEIQNVLVELSSLVSIKLEYVSDEEILKKNALKRELFFNGHPVMQILKYLCVLDAPTTYSLLMDGDTVFLKNKTWITKSTTTMILAQENYLIHRAFNQKFAGLNADSGFGFTNQSQILSKQIVSDIVESFGGAILLASLFNETCKKFFENKDRGLFPSELQLYGDWILERSKVHLALSSNRNISVSRSALAKIINSDNDIAGCPETYEFLKSVAPSAGSISFHAYK
jgi:hypothetical protein